MVMELWFCVVDRVVLSLRGESERDKEVVG